MTFSKFYSLIEESMHQNDKPSLDFDKKHGTHVSHEWKFPFNFDEDKVWDIIHRGFNAKYSGDYMARREMRRLVNALDERYFPYKGIKSLSEVDKIHTLMGMASRFNYYDILWFVVHGKFARDNPYNKLIHKGFSRPQWLVSPQTYKMILKQATK